MSSKLSLRLDPTLIRPLAEAQNDFLQVLLPMFQLRRKRPGVNLEIDFDLDSPAVWLRRGKRHLEEQLDRAKRLRYQQELEAMLLHRSRRSYTHDDLAFPFRFGNGGTLPVIRTGGRDYYCLFYRETVPIGWNIANGGASSLAELLDPVATIERELREELIIVEPAAGRRYVFDWNEGRPADHPDFAVARRVWKEVFHKLNFPDLEDVGLPLKWLPGSDTVTIRFERHADVVVQNCIVNINAADFGIEIDRVAKIAVGPDAVLCDGEVIRGRLMNRVIGLFEVHRFNVALAAGATEFLPDRVFFNGRERSGHDAKRAVKDYLRGAFSRHDLVEDSWGDYEATPDKFGLCPVTRNLIKRYLLLDPAASDPDAATTEMLASDRRAPVRNRNYDVFVSFCSEDHGLARLVNDYLSRRLGRNVFFSDETLHHTDFSRAIDEALEGSRALVAVGSRLEHLQRPWVRYEVQAFHLDILNGRKPEDAPLLAFVSNLAPHTLPAPLRYRQAVVCDPDEPEPALERLCAFLPRTLGREGPPRHLRRRGGPKARGSRRRS